MFDIYVYTVPIYMYDIQQIYMLTHTYELQLFQLPHRIKDYISVSVPKDLQVDSQPSKQLK